MSGHISVPMHGLRLAILPVVVGAVLTSATFAAAETTSLAHYTGLGPRPVLAAVHYRGHVYSAGTTRYRDRARHRADLLADARREASDRPAAAWDGPGCLGASGARRCDLSRDLLDRRARRRHTREGPDRSRVRDRDLAFHLWSSADPRDRPGPEDPTGVTHARCAGRAERAAPLVPDSWGADAGRERLFDRRTPSRRSPCRATPGSSSSSSRSNSGERFGEPVPTSSQPLEVRINGVSTFVCTGRKSKIDTGPKARFRPI